MRVAGPKASAGSLRREIAARNRARVAEDVQEISYGRSESVVYAAGDDGGHGNFLPSSYRRILACPAWARRLEKAYTGDQWMPRAADRTRRELECAASSDALLMNVFCYPGVLRRPALCRLLDVATGVRPEFGVRAGLPMRGGEVDRTELDMALGDTLVEAKLTEGGFGQASRDRLTRYLATEELFDLEALPRVGAAFAGYQIVRGLLAAERSDGRYLVLLDARRADLAETCFAVLAAARSAALRSRLQLRTWQELAAVLPPTLQRFMAERYGIAG